MLSYLRVKSISKKFILYLRNSETKKWIQKVLMKFIRIDKNNKLR